MSPFSRKKAYGGEEKHYRRSMALFSTHKDILTWTKGHHQMGNVNIERMNWASGR